MNINKTTIILILTIILTLSSISFFWFAVNTIFVNGEELKQSIVDIKNFESIKQEMTESQKILSETVEERKYLKERLFTEDDTVEFLSLIESIAMAKGISVKTSNLNAEKGEGMYGTLSSTFKVSGTEQGVLDMLQLFESLPYHSTIKNFQYIRNNTSRKKPKTVDMIVGIEFTLQNI